MQHHFRRQETDWKIGIGERPVALALKQTKNSTKQTKNDTDSAVSAWISVWVEQQTYPCIGDCLRAKKWIMFCSA